METSIDVGSVCWVNLDGHHVAGIVLEVMKYGFKMIHFDDGVVMEKPTQIRKEFVKLPTSKWDFAPSIFDKLDAAFEEYIEPIKWKYV